MTMNKNRISLIKEVQNTFGITPSELAHRLGMTPQGLNSRVHAEGDGEIKLGELAAIADALGCEFVYELRPRNHAMPKKRQAVRIVPPDILHEQRERRRYQKGNYRDNARRLRERPPFDVEIAQFNPLTREICLFGTTLRATPTEFLLLEVLARFYPQSADVSSLSRAAWQTETPVSANHLRVLINNLRRRLAEENVAEILTVRGQGYRLVRWAEAP